MEGSCNPYSGSGGGGSGPTGPAGPTWFSFGIQGPIGDGGDTDPFAYYPPPGGYVANADEIFAVALVDFTITALQVYLKGVFRGVGATLVVTVRVEAVDTAATVTLGPSESEASISGLSIAVAAGEHYSISITGTGVDDYPSNLIGQVYYTT